MSVEAVERGRTYTIKTPGDRLINVTFCHKNPEGVFQDGHTVEDLVAVLTDRYEAFIEMPKGRTPDNLEALSLLLQLSAVVNRRRKEKQKRKRAYQK